MARIIITDQLTSNMHPSGKQPTIDTLQINTPQKNYSVIA